MAGYGLRIRLCYFLLPIVAFLRKRFSFSELTKPFTDVVDSAKNKIDDIKNSITEWTEEAKCYVGCLEKDSTATMMACGLKCKYLP